MSHYVLSEWWSPSPFPNFKQLPPAVSPLGFKCKDARCTFKLPSCLQITFFQILCDYSQVNSLTITSFLFLFVFFFIFYLYVIYFMYLALFCVLFFAILRIVMWKKHKCWRFSEGRLKPRGTNCPLHLKSGPGRDGPSFALYWLAAEHFDIPSPYMKVNRTKGHLYCRNVKLIFCCKTQ